VLGEGIEEERARLPLGVDYFVFFLSLLFDFVKGDSHPEICAQRTDFFIVQFLWCEELTRGPLGGALQHFL
jgi:hypothetical protein